MVRLAVGLLRAVEVPHDETLADGAHPLSEIDWDAVDWTNFRSREVKEGKQAEWDWPKRIDRDALEAALRLEFIEGGRNIILVAPQGLGKTMLARNIANQAVLAGHSVLFATAAQMLLDLAAQDSARALERRFRHYCRPTLHCIDEIGYLSYDARNADLLFQIISRRYEHKASS